MPLQGGSRMPFTDTTADGGGHGYQVIYFMFTRTNFLRKQAEE